MAHFHPGEHLKEFLEEYNITAYRLAKDINVPATRIDQIIKSKRGISTDTAARLGKYFGTSPQMWANLQFEYERGQLDHSAIDKICTLA